MRRDLLIKEAKKGNAIAQEELGTKLWTGYWGRPNKKEAVEWYRRSADQGCAEAQYFLSRAYFDGIGVEKDRKKAFEWAKKSTEAEWSSIDGHIAVGWHYLNGVEVEKDIEEAKQWFLQAANVGSSIAAYSLGSVFEGQKDFINAAHWYWVACAKNHPQSLYRLGRLYLHGRGVPRNSNLGKKYLKMAKIRGVHLADKLIISNISENIPKNHCTLSAYCPPIDQWCGIWKHDAYYSYLILNIEGKDPVDILITENNPEDDNQLRQVEKAFFREGRLIVDVFVSPINYKVRQVATLIHHQRMLLFVNKINRPIFLNKV